MRRTSSPRVFNVGAHRDDGKRFVVQSGIMHFTKAAETRSRGSVHISPLQAMQTYTPTTVARQIDQDSTWRLDQAAFPSLGASNWTSCVKAGCRTKREQSGSRKSARGKVGPLKAA